MWKRSEGGVAALKVLRLSVPLTQRELAVAANLHENTLSKIECGKGGRIRPGTMRAIAEALGVGPGDVDEFRERVQR